MHTHRQTDIYHKYPFSVAVYSEVTEGARTTFAASTNVQQDAFYNSPVQRVVAIYDYDAQGEEEISLRDGDIVTVLKKEDDVWWLGELRNGKQGMFPKDYVEVLGARV